VNSQVDWEILALDQAAGFLRDDPAGIAALWESISRLAEQPRPPDRLLTGPQICDDCGPTGTGSSTQSTRERRVIQIDHVARLP
jgi:hypothetical protein